MRIAGLVSMMLALTMGEVARGNEVVTTDCSSLKAYSKSHGFAFEIMWFHAIYPAAVESRQCPKDVKVTGKRLKKFVANYVAAAGCGPGTAVYDAMVKPVDEIKLEKQLSEQKLSKIPERYLSKDPNFCALKKLAAINTCVDSPGSFFEVPNK